MKVEIEITPSMLREFAELKKRISRENRTYEEISIKEFIEKYFSEEAIISSIDEIVEEYYNVEKDKNSEITIYNVLQDIVVSDLGEEKQIIKAGETLILENIEGYYTFPRILEPSRYAGYDFVIDEEYDEILERVF